MGGELTQVKFRCSILSIAVSSVYNDDMEYYKGAMLSIIRELAGDDAVGLMKEHPVEAVIKYCSD